MRSWKGTEGKTVIIRGPDGVIAGKVEDLNMDKVRLSILDLDGFPTGEKKLYNLIDITLLEVLK